MHARPRFALATVALAAGFAAPGIAAAAEDDGVATGWLLGGSDSDEALAIAADRAGAVYVTGRTLSADFPGAVLPVRGSDVFVVKLDASGVAYSTLIGGSAADEGLAIAVDREGRAFVAGQTWSSDFPGQPAGGAGDAFVLELGPDGALESSTPLGGAGRDAALGIALHDGAAYVTGYTASPGVAGATDAFVDVLDGGRVVSSTLLGGGGPDAGFGIAVDRGGAVYVAGRTASPESTGGTDAFVAEVGGYTTRLGGAALDGAAAIAVDRDGTAYVTGVTYSPDFPATTGAYAGDADAFAAALNADGSVRYVSLLGDGGRDEGAAIAVHHRRARIAGQASSDAFAAELTAAGAPGWRERIGGSGYDAATAIAQGAEGSPVYVAGTTLSADFPGRRSGPGGWRDAFVTAYRAGDR